VRYVVTSIYSTRKPVTKNPPDGLIARDRYREIQCKTWFSLRLRYLKCHALPPPP
jgi:hypothetical protein